MQMRALAIAAGLVVPSATFGAPHAGSSRTPIATLTFRSVAQIRGNTIRLQDVATIASQDHHLVAALERIEICSAPLPGRWRQVYPGYTIAHLRQIGVDPALVVFAGAGTTRVTRTEQIVAAAALAKVACRSVEAREQGTVATATFDPPEAHVPIGSVEVRALEPRMFGDVSGIVPVQVLVDGNVEASAVVSIRLARHVRAVVANHDLRSGDVVGQNDVHIEELPATFTSGILTELDNAVGRQTTSHVRAGTPLTASLVRPAIVVKRGDVVRLVCSGPNFTATVSGEALEDGAPGKLIRVRNLSSNQILSGEVNSADTVNVPY